MFKELSPPIHLYQNIYITRTLKLGSEQGGGTKRLLSHAFGYGIYD